MRPFRFFFMISLGVMLFFFVARFLLFAFFAAAVLSVVFFLGRKLRNFFMRLDWDEDDYARPPFRRRYRRSIRKPVWKGDLLLEYPAREREYLPNFRTIEVV